MFENIEIGQTVTLKMQGSTQGLAMRAIYDGEVTGTHHLHGFGIMKGVEFTAEQDAEGWALGNGRRLFAVEA
jgi:hypothetical protein